MSSSLAPFKVACLQLTAGDDMTVNIDEACQMVREAALVGAQLVLLPENVAMMTLDGDHQRANAHPEDRHPAVAAFSALAQDLDIWLHAGTLAVPVGDKLVNRTLVFSPTGEIAATYDKIHMFDVDLENGESYRETDTFSPGSRAVVAPLPWGGLGLSTCYDVRFAYLYRTLAEQGAIMLAVPAAFTVPTGQAHWQVLLRARAIETGCYVFAPTQTGTHAGGRKTYGHALIIDPWGVVLADGGDQPGMILADVDPAHVDRVRAMVPSLSHSRAIRS